VLGGVLGGRVRRCGARCRVGTAWRLLHQRDANHQQRQ
jgi:hypothetical protein